MEIGFPTNTHKAQGVMQPHRMTLITPSKNTDQTPGPVLNIDGHQVGGKTPR